MVARLFTERAEKAGERYLMAIEGFRGAWHGVFSHVRPTSGQARLQFHESLYGVARAFIDTEATMITEGTGDIARRALADAREALGVVSDRPEQSDALTGFLTGAGDYLRQEIAIQLERDVAAMMSLHNRFSLQAEVLARARGWDRQAAIAHLKLADRGEVKLYFADRNGRRWPSQKYVRSAWRQHLLHTHNEVYIHTLAEHGETLAMVAHLDPNHRKAGLVFSIGSDDTMPVYQDIREEVFHPNSDAFVTVYISQS